MNKSILLISILVSLNLFKKTAEEHYKEAEEYSSEIKTSLYNSTIPLCKIPCIIYLAIYFFDYYIYI